MMSYVTVAWYRCREVQVRLTYSLTQERGYQVSRLLAIEEVELSLLKAA